jgi:hypothetical protein
MEKGEGSREVLEMASVSGFYDDTNKSHGYKHEDPVQDL